MMIRSVLTIDCTELVCIDGPSIAFGQVQANRCSSLLWQCSSICIYFDFFHLFPMKLVSIGGQ